MKRFGVKVTLALYTLIICVVPAPPSIYTFILSTLGLIFSLFSLTMIFQYLWSRPPMQQTVAQPLTMVIVVSMATLTLKEYVIAVLGNIFPSLLQSLFDGYPFLMCGFLNNRLNSFSILYTLAILGTSKLILLVKPMVYHSADHDLIIKASFQALAALFLVDTFVYLFFGNIYYCHMSTMERVAAIYNMTADFSLVKEQHVGRIHELLDHSLFAALILLEISINGYTLVKYNKIMTRFTQVQTCMLRNGNIRPVQSTEVETPDKDNDTGRTVETDDEAGPSNTSIVEGTSNNTTDKIFLPDKLSATKPTKVNMFHGNRSIQYNNFLIPSETSNSGPSGSYYIFAFKPLKVLNSEPSAKYNNVVQPSGTSNIRQGGRNKVVTRAHRPINQVNSSINDPRNPSTSNLSNKKTILVHILLYATILLVRREVYGAVYMFQTYARFMEYALPVIWIFVNQNFTDFVHKKITQWKLKLTEQ